MSLATSTILFEKRRYSTAVIAIAFCGALILSFTGLFSGVAVSYSALTNSTPAHLVVLNADAASWFDASEIPARVIPEIYSHPEVAEVDELDVAGAEWNNLGASGGSKEPMANRIVRAEVTERALPSVKVGQEVQLYSEHNPRKTYKGKVKRIAAMFGARRLDSEQADRKTDERVVEVIVDVDGLDLLIGQRVMVRFAPAGARGG